MATQKYKDPQQGVSVTQEDGGVGKAGLYRHPNGREAICTWDPLFGNTQANAFERLGFVWVRDVEPDEIKQIDLTAIAANAQEQDGMRGINARVRMLEDVHEQNKLLEQENQKLREEMAEKNKTDQTAISGEHARQNAVDQTNQRAVGDEVVKTGEGDVVPAADAPKDEEPAKVDLDDEDGDDDEVSQADKPLAKQNTTELRATATAEGLELTDEHDTKSKIVKAIEANRLNPVAAKTGDDKESEN